MRILVTPTSFTYNEEILNKLKKRAFVDVNPKGCPLSEEDLLSISWDYDAVIAGLDNITARVIEKASPRLKVISRYGVGYENIDVKRAGDLGIPVTNTPGVNSESVADLTFALVLCAARHIPELYLSVRQGMWPRKLGMEVHGKTLGVVGLGSIGKAVCKRAKGFSMKILAYDPYVACVEDESIELCGLERLFMEADIITLHVPLNEETKGLINRDSLKIMKDGVILVNTARGPLIVEEDVIEFIESGKIGAVGFDVFNEEPPRNCKLLGYPNVVATPHVGAHTKEALSRMAELAVSNMFDILEGKECENVVNREYLRRI
ncbi:MAG TPA: phosphoglycerate dehydrogenase [Clostridiaceae bacterium]|jgi:D-3-phosphoglycerate dehydrogenase|nr:phosphoglycerate dehydrogenase [Clostridiaceae bacterium]